MKNLENSTVRAWRVGQVDRRCRLAAAGALLLAVLLAAGTVAGASPEEVRLVLGDGCAVPGQDEIQLPVLLLGEGFRPSSLRTTLLFDPALLEPVLDIDAETAEPGPALSGSVVDFGATGDPLSGRVDLVLHRQGTLPVAGLPAGTVATVRLRVKPLAAGAPALRIDLDPGQTRSLDGNGRPMFTATGGPAYVWLGQSGLWLVVGSEAGVTRIEAGGDLLREQTVILRGRLTEARGSGRRVSFGPLERLDSAWEGRRAVDPLLPGPGEAFFYIAAQVDAAGRPALGFASDCRARRPASPPPGAR
jgi:hypothetical protein